MPPTPPTPYSWETTELNNNIPEQLDHHQPVQRALNPQHQPQSVFAPSPPVIELQEHMPTVPSQRRSEVPQHLHHMSSAPGSSSRRQNVVSQDMRPHIHVDTTSHMAASTSPPSGPPSASGVHSVGPVRAKVSPAHNMGHPYRRPQSANPRRENESNPHVRQSTSSYTPGPSMLVPAAQTTTSASLHKTAIISPSHVIPPISSSATFIPRADYFFCSESRVTTAMFELPGVKKSDLKIELSSCQNGLKQVSITGETRQPLADGIIALKERKYGKFRRVLPVRHDTKKEDVSVTLEDGVLILRIHMGPPLGPEQESEIILIP